MTVKGDRALYAVAVDYNKTKVFEVDHITLSFEVFGAVVRIGKSSSPTGIQDFGQAFQVFVVTGCGQQKLGGAYRIHRREPIVPVFIGRAFDDITCKCPESSVRVAAM